MQFTIRQARTYAGLTQREMEAYLSVDVSTYIKMEKNPNRVTLRQLSRISEVTKIPMINIFLSEDSTLVKSDKPA